ncbi:MAG: sulfatase family protein [Candidatus Hydrogenedentota bacterium]
MNRDKSGSRRAGSISRRQLLRYGAGLAGLAVAARLPKAVGAEQSSGGAGTPNIVYILADDLGWGDPKCYNPDSQVDTPNIDRLASEGMRLTDAHSPSAVCTPTRYGTLTGRYAWRTRLESGVLQGYSRALIEPDRLTAGGLLQEAGYHTAGVGKWHLGFQAYDPEEDENVDYEEPLTPGPVTQGFDQFFGIPASLDFEPYLWVEDDAPIAQPTDEVEASAHRREDGGGFWREGAIAPDFKHIEVQGAITTRSVQYIEERAKEAPDQPFFLYVPLASPHTPWLPTAPFRGETDAGYYGDFVKEVDWSVGQILHALDRTGVADDTLVIVTSDNGAHWPEADIEEYGHRANGPWRGQKADIHEGGHRVPFIARWPGRIPAGVARGDLFCLTDLMATFAAMLDRDVPEDAAEDSYNQLPVLLDEALDEPVREAVVHHSLNGTFAIRKGPWKLIPDNLGSGGFTSPRQEAPGEGDPGGQLYNLEEDPAEERNVHDDHPEVVEELRALLQQYKDTGRSRP